ncbi:AVAST type 3 anti-phage proein Avs3b [Paenibacillus agricola]|uniref:Uncharacterized protein n=1 Tax=Paenibacillus agricola TaxID=2716264 RepID=A0ABX0JD51_9BACL|nr:AVAST type 3 anti-phage proein Avs3b [Paenibacillus agricola]NHN31620.1 hypothetical protein [Paenibacillus agricola]
MNIDHRITEFLSSRQTEDSETQKHIINLGKKLVAELGLDPGFDTLARWMAHYIAEQIEFAENAVGDEKDEAERRCFETILKLWEHRSDLPSGQRPFESFEPIFRALDRLDPENDDPYYFFDRRETNDNAGGVQDDVQKWLDIAKEIDQVARVWLEYVFKQAALCAVDDNTREWLEHSVGLHNNDETSVLVRFLNYGESVQEETKRDLIISRIKKLEVFNEMNKELLSIYEQELAELESGK